MVGKDFDARIGVGELRGAVRREWPGGHSGGRFILTVTGG
jgi:hypothetical protein